MPYTVAYNKRPPKYYAGTASEEFLVIIQSYIPSAPEPVYPVMISNYYARDESGNQSMTGGGVELTWRTTIKLTTAIVAGTPVTTGFITVKQNIDFEWVHYDVTGSSENPLLTATFSGQEDATTTTSFATWQRRTATTTAATWLWTTRATGGSGISGFSSVRKINESQWLGNTYSTSTATITGLTTCTSTGVAMTTKSAELYNYGAADYYVYCFPGESFLIPVGDGITQYTTATSYDAKWQEFATGIGGPYRIGTSVTNPLITAIEGNTTIRSVLTSAGLNEFPPAFSTIPFNTYTSRLDIEVSYEQPPADWEGDWNGEVPVTSRESWTEGQITYPWNSTFTGEHIIWASFETQSAVSIEIAGDFSVTRRVELPSPEIGSYKAAQEYGLGVLVQGWAVGPDVLNFQGGVTVLSRDIDGVHFLLPTKSTYEFIEPAQALSFQNTNTRYKDAPAVVSASPNVVMYMPADTSLKFSVVNGSSIQESEVTTARISLTTDKGFEITTASMLNSSIVVSQTWNHGMKTSGDAFYGYGNNTFADPAGIMGIAAWSPRAKGPLTVLLSPGIYKIVTDSGSSTASAMTTLSSQSSRTISAIKGVNTIYYAYSAGASFSNPALAGDYKASPGIIGANYGQFF